MLSVVFVSIIFILFAAAIETISPGLHRMQWEWRSSFFKGLMPSQKSESDFLEFFNQYIAPALKLVAYGFLAYGIIGYIMELVSNADFRILLIVPYCIVLTLLFLLDCVISKEKLKKTIFFSRWETRSIFLVKKFIPILLIVLCVFFLPEICYSIPS